MRKQRLSEALRMAITKDIEEMDAKENPKQSKLAVEDSPKPKEAAKVKCTNCDGTGLDGDNLCVPCEGSGLV